MRLVERSQGVEKRRRGGRVAGVLGSLLGTALALAISLDRWGNRVLGGDPSVTISTRCGQELRMGDPPTWWCAPLCRALDVLDEDHCLEARQ